MIIEVEITGDGAVVQSEAGMLKETIAIGVEVSALAQINTEAVEEAGGAGAAPMTVAHLLDVALVLKRVLLPKSHLIAMKARLDATVVNVHFPEVNLPGLEGVGHIPRVHPKTALNRYSVFSLFC